jgi:hypothetical protein
VLEPHRLRFGRVGAGGTHGSIAMKGTLLPASTVVLKEKEG